MDSESDPQVLEINSRRNTGQLSNGQPYLVDQKDVINSSKSSSSSKEIKSEISSDEAVEESQENKLQEIIIKEAITMEKKIAYNEHLCQQELRRFHIKLNEYEKETKVDEQQLMRLIKQLFLAKLLVSVYDKNIFRLVIAHYRLGKCYLNTQCYDMAIEHISIALYKNQKLGIQFSKCRMLQPYMYNAKAQALIKRKNYQEAINILINNLSDSKLNIPYSESWDKSTILLAQSYCLIERFQQALQTINGVLSQNKKTTKSSHHRALALVQKASILAANHQYLKAIECQESAIKILVDINYWKPQQVVKMYEVVSKYYDLAMQPENALLSMQKVRTLYQELYSEDNPQVIKARRKIAVSLLKNQRYKQAVNELIQIVEIEQKVLGQGNLATARTLKLLGVVYRTLDTNNAKVYLNKSLKIFQKFGIAKQVTDIKNKILTINSINNGRTMDIFPHSQQEI